ncbi:MAG: PQQ-binding-like beta-propeller repeat protein [Candidatus Xenobiia bacterium LiM19]
MNIPSLEESRKIIVGRAMEIAKWTLEKQGKTFRRAKDENDVMRCKSETAQMLKETSYEGMASCLLQFRDYWEDDMTEMAVWLSKKMCEFGDYSFYKKNRSDFSIYELAAGLDLENFEASWETISVLVQGTPCRPRLALPYAVLAAHLDPGKNEIDYIIRKINEVDADEITREHDEQVELPENDWPTAGGNSSRTGVSPVIVAPPLSLAWTFDGCGYIRSGIVISESIVVFGDKNGTLYGINMNDGSKRWEYNLHSPVYGTPAIMDGRIFAGSSGKFACIDLMSGREIWTYSAGDYVYKNAYEYQGTTLFFKDRIVLCDYYIDILDCEEGKLADRIETNGIESYSHLGACGEGSNVYVPTRKELYEINLRSNEIRTVRAAGTLSSGPVIAGEKVLYGAARANVVCLDRGELSELWEFKIEGNRIQDYWGWMIVSRPVYVEGKTPSESRVYFGGRDGNFYALNAKTGSRVWKYTVGHDLISPSMVSGETIYVMAVNGDLLALSTKEGSLLWRYETGVKDEDPHTAAAPAITKDKIFIGSDRLYAFEPLS